MELIAIVLFPTFTITSFLIGRRMFARRALANSAGEILVEPVEGKSVFGAATEAMAAVLPVTTAKRDRFAKDLLASGDYRSSAVNEFLAKRNFGVLTALLASLSLFALGLADGIEWIVAIAGGVVCLLCYALPRIMLSGKSTRRTQEISRAIPDAMDMIAMSLQGGLPLPVAIGQVAKRMQNLFPALTEELGIVFRQAQSGSAADAYDGFANRIELPEVIAFCAMMKQSQKLGGGLAQSLRDYASRIRVDRQSRAERSGNTASLKLLFPVVLCLAPPIAVVLIGPAVIDLKSFIDREKGATVAAIQEVQ